MEKRQSVLSSKVFENTGSRSRRAKPASITPNAMEKKYDASRAVMTEDVDMVLGNLKKIGALDE